MSSQVFDQPMQAIPAPSPFIRDTRPIYYIDGAAIRRAREAKGLGLREAARLLGLSSTYCSKVENNRSECISLSLKTLQALERLYLGKVITT